MVKIENKEIEIKGSKTDYKDLLKACNDQTPERGFSVTEMKNRLRISDALDKENIELEDSDFTNLKSLVNSMSWAVADKALVDFVEYINELK